MEIKEALLEIKENVVNGNTKKYDFGVCSVLYQLSASNCYAFVNTNCIDWKHFSGNMYYPVSGEDVWLVHAKNHTLWKGEQLELRLSLIDHLLTKC